MYQYYQVLLCLLKFDFFAFTGVTIQVGALAYVTLSFSYDTLIYSFSSLSSPRIQQSLA